MEQYIIKGGHPLVGEVEIGGAKNAALAILAAAIMTDETVLVDNLPDVNDINVLLDAISGIGANVHRVDRHTVKINGKGINDVNIEYDYIKKIRASYYLLGALLGKYKRAEVALPGGCNIGSRPIDQHIKGFRALGADVDIEYGKIMAEADRLVGKHIYFDVVSVGATINVMMATTMAEGSPLWKCGKRAACGRRCQLPQQHGGQHQRRGNRRDQDSRRAAPAQYGVFCDSGSDRGRDIHVRGSGNKGRRNRTECYSKASGGDHCEAGRDRMRSGKSLMMLSAWFPKET